VIHRPPGKRKTFNGHERNDPASGDIRYSRKPRKAMSQLRTIRNELLKDFFQSFLESFWKFLEIYSGYAHSQSSKHEGFMRQLLDDVQKVCSEALNFPFSSSTLIFASEHVLHQTSYTNGNLYIPICRWVLLRQEDLS